MMAQTYLHRGRRQLQKWAENPQILTGAWAAVYALAGFLLSAAGVCGSFQPIAMGAVLASTGWRAAILCFGSMAGYRVFWGHGGVQGAMWSAAAGMTALLAGKKSWFTENPAFPGMVCASMVSCIGLLFQVLWGDNTGLAVYFLRIVIAGASAVLWNQTAHRRDAVTDWVAGGVGVLALAQVMPVPYFGLGYLTAGLVGVTGPFPAAAMAGLGLDLAQVTKVPMAAVICIAYFLRLIPVPKFWMRYCAPAAACVGVMAVCRTWDLQVLPGLLLGGMLGMLLPPRPETVYHRGPTGAAQVRLELGAEMMGRMQQLLLEQEEPGPDEQAFIDLARQRACAGCSFRKGCGVRRRLSTKDLQNPMNLTCRRTGRLLGELRRSQEQLKTVRLEHARRQEYRQALEQQYRFLSDYLRQLADQIPRRDRRAMASWRIEVSARSRKKEQANGDRCLAFSGNSCRYYVLLCDGMGTGLGAAEESRVAGNLLKQMLLSGFPAEYALRSLNNLLVLRGQGGAVTVDLAEIRLDTGRAAVYKWGAAPSWLLGRREAKKIGTAAAPPGLSVTETRESVTRLSLSRGEVLILLSDGVDGEGALRREDLTPDVPPGELAETILERGCGRGEDDATAVAIRLRSTGPS